MSENKVRISMDIDEKGFPTINELSGNATALLSTASMIVKLISMQTELRLKDVLSEIINALGVVEQMSEKDLDKLIKKAKEQTNDE